MWCLHFLFILKITHSRDFEERGLLMFKENARWTWQKKKSVIMIGGKAAINVIAI